MDHRRVEALESRWCNDRNTYLCLRPDPAARARESRAVVALGLTMIVLGTALFCVVAAAFPTR